MNENVWKDPRSSVLAAVRAQLKFLQEAQHRQGAAPQPEDFWSQQQWWEALNFLFVTSKWLEQTSHHDDLLFFVYTKEHAREVGEPYTLRRRAAQLPQDFHLSGSMFSKFLWDETLLLNAALQTQYQLTVVACSHAVLAQVAEGHFDVAGAKSVTKTVHATPTRLKVNLDSNSKEDYLPVPSYPDICFAVENFNDAFEDVVLTQPDDCYCVMLQALIHPCNSSSATHLATHHAPASTTASSGGPALQQSHRRLTLFSGYVSHQQISEHLGSMRAAPEAIIGRLFTKEQHKNRDKVTMTGPGGVGQAEVAVAMQKMANQASASHSKGLLQSVFGVAKAIVSDGSRSIRHVPLQCALMLLSLPVQMIARYILDTTVDA